MGKKYTADELNNCSKETLITILLSMQDQTERLNQNMERLIEQIAVSNQEKFGRKSEKLEVMKGQLNLSDFDALFNEAEFLTQNLYVVEPFFDDICKDEVVERKKKQKGKREADLKDFEVEIISHELDEEQLKEIFGDKWKRLPDETYKRLKMKPATYIVEEHHVAVYAGTDNQTIVKADRPKDLLRNSIATPSVVSAIINAKYVNAMPLYRIEQEFKRNEVNLSRTVMANWVIQCSEKYLAVMYDYLHEMMYDFHVIHADETPVKVSKDGRSAGSKSYMWVYRTGKMYETTPIVLYEYQKNRVADHPRKFLADFNGVCVTDGYQVYHSLEEELENLTVAGCWSHARRRFAEAVKALKKETATDTVAYKALQQIAAIYKLDNALAKFEAKERAEQRNLIIRPLVEAFFAWIKEQQKQMTVTPKSKTGEGIAYCINQEKYLKVFLDDGEVPMDNNAAEQAIRGFCIGKHNWHLIDTMEGAKASAIAYSIVETAKANNLKPYNYIEYLLTEIPKHLDDTDRSFLKNLLPWSKELPESCRRILK